jgi:hypothetical protein
MAAFGAAPGEYGAPIFAAHTYPEPVRLCPFAIVRLKCAFWHVIFLGPGKRPETLK